MSRDRRSLVKKELEPESTDALLARSKDLEMKRKAFVDLSPDDPRWDDHLATLNQAYQDLALAAESFVSLNEAQLHSLAGRPFVDSESAARPSSVG